jgi:hemoglobin-like flavoprotein
MGDNQTPQIVQIVDQSYGRCLTDPDFLYRFYQIFMDSHELIRPLFANTDFERQTQALRNGLGMMIRYMEDPTDIVVIHGLKRIRESHGQYHLNVHPHLYDYWLDSLIRAIRICDPVCNRDIEEAWRTALQPGIEFIRSGYKEEGKEEGEK